MFFDVIEIFDHAHPVFCAVTLIQRFQALAGIIFTLEAEPEFTLGQQRAPVGHVRAVFASGNAAWAIGPVEALFVQVALLELVRST